MQLPQSLKSIFVAVLIFKSMVVFAQNNNIEMYAKNNGTIHLKVEGTFISSTGEVITSSFFQPFAGTKPHSTPPSNCNYNHLLALSDKNVSKDEVNQLLLKSFTSQCDYQSGYSNKAHVSYDLNGRINKIGLQDVSYDLNGRVEQIGNTDISYDLWGRVDEIGSQDVSYDLDGRVEQIGDTDVTYGLDGDVDEIGSQEISYALYGHIVQINNSNGLFEREDSHSNANSPDIPYCFRCRLNESGSMDIFKQDEVSTDGYTPMTIGYKRDGRVKQIGNDNISYNLFGLVNHIGSTSISYDFFGRIKQVGSTTIRYNLQGQVKQVGSYAISYNHSGHIKSNE